MLTESQEVLSDLPQLAIELQMDSDGTMQPQAHSKVIYLMMAVSSSTLPWNIHSRRIHLHTWTFGDFGDQYFRDMQNFTKIHKDVVSRKFGAVRYVATSSGNILFIDIS